MSTKEQKIVDEAHTVEIKLTEKAGGGKIVIHRNSAVVSVTQDGIVMRWPAPIAYMAGKMLMHLAELEDPSLKGTL